MDVSFNHYNAAGYGSTATDSNTYTFNDMYADMTPEQQKQFEQNLENSFNSTMSQANEAAQNGQNALDEVTQENS